MCRTIHNGNRTEWSPIRSVIIRVINKIGRLRSGGPIYLITRNFQEGDTFSVFESAVNSVISNSQPQTTGLRMHRLR